MATVIKTTFQLKRGTKERWEELNLVLANGEPGFEIDTGRLKIGDGVLAWLDLNYIGSEYIFNANTVKDFPTIGNMEVIYRAFEERVMYQWNPSTKTYEPYASGEVDLTEIKQTIKNLTVATEKIKYEVVNKPINTLISYAEQEIRIMCPADTQWQFQQGGEGSDSNSYYIGFRAYAPDGANAFKEDLAEEIQDNTLYYFENNPFAGIDEYGRKYSIVWLPVAHYDGTQWNYYGKSSTNKKYIGWYYTVEWYNTNNEILNRDTIKINLSNEACHNNNEPYYMSSININKLAQNDGEYLILYGGSAIDNI